jgi:hypothetical protein
LGCACAWKCPRDLIDWRIDRITLLSRSIGPDLRLLASALRSTQIRFDSDRVRLVFCAMPVDALAHRKRKSPALRGFDKIQLNSCLRELNRQITFQGLHSVFQVQLAALQTSQLFVFKYLTS